MQITDKLLKPVKETNYLNVDNTDRYRPNLRIFYLKYETMKYWLYQEDVYEELTEDPYFKDYTPEQCQQDLSTLVNWGNLVTIQDTKNVRTIEEFKNRKYQYQLSEYAVEIERMIIHLENLSVEGASLEPNLLERIKREILQLGNIGEESVDEVYSWWQDLENDFVRLNQNYQDYMRTLNSVKAEELMKTKEFLVFKDHLIEYLRAFVKSLQQNVTVIESYIKETPRETIEAILEHQVLEQEYKALQTSDAARLKEDENRLLEEERQNKSELEDNAKKIQIKKEERLDKENLEKAKQQENEELWMEITDILEDVADYMAEGAFDEWQYLAKELKETPDAEYDFQYHEDRLADYTGKVKEGIRILQKEEDCRRRYDEILQELDAKRKQQDQTEREWRQYERFLREEKDRWIESLYKWSSNNTLLTMQPEQLQNLVRKIEAYRYGDEYAEIKDIAREQKQWIEDDLREKKGKLQVDKTTLEKEMKTLEDELEEWENKEEAEPERSEEVKQNRERLHALDIPFSPLYKVIDFDGHISEEQRDRLEAALYHMGILDALIVDSDYREQVLNLDGELCDKYLFSDIASVKQSLIDIMHADGTTDDILFNHQVSQILTGICFQEKDGSQSTWIDENGHYRIGVLEGNVPEGYKSCFIGAAARERHRLSIINTLLLQKQELEEKLAVLEQKIASVVDEMQLLIREFGQFPSEEDIKEAAKNCAETERQLEGIRREILQISNRLEQEKERLQKIQKLVNEISVKTGLPNKLSIFEETMESLTKYNKALTDIRIAHNKYLNGFAFINTYRDEIEKLDADLDDLLYEKSRINRRLDKCQQELQLIREQLKLTNYNEIQEKLDYYLKRLNEIPQEKEASKGRTGALNTNIQNSQEHLESEVVELSLKDQKRRTQREIFQAEHRLGYVSYDFVPTEAIEELAGKICKMLYGQFGNKTQLSLLGSLQEVYHRQKGLLSEYQLTMNNLFEELLETMPKESSVRTEDIIRLDIRAKYRGTDISFRNLVGKLEEDMEALSALLSERDRELFEDILSNTISKKIRAKIYESRHWIENMNKLMESMQTSSGLKLNLKWVSRKSEKENQLDTADLVELLQRDVEIMRQEDIDKISTHFRSRIAEARNLSKAENTLQSFHVIMKEILDYRKWFEFQLYFQKTGERKREMTDRMFFTFSGGEKAMSMYVPLFSAVVAKYSGANADAPRMISLDEAFAGVDEMNIKDMFRLMISLDLNFIINSQVLWGDYDTVPGLAIYHLLRPLNAKSVTVLRYIWNGNEKLLITEESV